MHALRSLVCIVFLFPMYSYGNEAFSFGVVAKPLRAATADTLLHEAIEETDADNLAFVVANGIKADDEPCSDELYKTRRTLFDNAKNGLVVSVAASDWADCTGAKNRSIATERIRRLREMFFTDDFSFGDSKIPLIRQSTIPSFRMYAENMHWRIGDVLFATINLPANNNNYLNAAGRNSEFEDRQVANNDWLKRIFITAKVGKLNGIVFFCDGNPMIHTEHSSSFFSSSKREGYADVRRQIAKFGAAFHGRILIVHGEPDPARKIGSKNILWQGNIGTFAAETPWSKIKVDPVQSQLFAVVTPDSGAQRTAHR
ncbi:MAG TPA: hypothetical protein VN114_04225 [Oxalicibacterium sp.]|uniref:hypothetical protein n=1 Tax=Oxalicibacterium sp. TaxID=2766525 RepID=UPI002CFAD484|nr:hypothetical protein [Oxalicibacterium sp.]HWU97698.1 hypothetical protein [Oxalicibacterium sp.]